MRRMLMAAVLAALLYSPAAGAWTWPTGGEVLQPFSFDPGHPYAGGQHRGVDIAAPAGADVVAPEAGTVTFAGTVPASGKSVTITTGDGLAVTLTHLGSIAVAEGTVLAEGAVLGTVGPSGDPEVSGAYVHLGIRVAAEPQGYRDPLAYLPARTASPAPSSSAAPASPVSSPAAASAAPPSPAPSAPAAPPA
ncbi:MAG: M23 family metallopeptidase, partial [Actinobacteria bacterium]|nr:M23 family metallopeptidase [Actinomycetota bacterium]